MKSGHSMNVVDPMFDLKDQGHQVQKQNFRYHFTVPQVVWLNTPIRYLILGLLQYNTGRWAHINVKLLHFRKEANEDI